ncbi:MAG: filamentous hemagglutinin family protein, partial [Gammaproteobacteria bacterium]
MLKSLQFKSALVGLSFSLIAGTVNELQAAPAGANVIKGNVVISSQANTTSIKQNSQSAVINWSSFNISGHETVNFIQPSLSSTALNQIFDQNPSQILGSINANGRVFLSNPNGLIFGVGSTVNVGALVATSLDIDADKFMNGEYFFSSDLLQSGAIINYGLLQAATGGSISLLGNSVENHGVIIAEFGQVELANGRQAVLNFDGDGLINFQVDADVVSNLSGTESGLLNSGEIQADGGRVLLTSHQAESVFENAINNTGMISATKISSQGGEIYLTGATGRVISSGDINASSNDGIGGVVHILGDQVGLFGEASVDVSGRDGGGVVLIGGDFQGSNPGIKNAQQTYVGSETTISADAIDEGDGGGVIIWADDTARIYGSIFAKGGEQTGNGGFVETSGKNYLDITQSPNLSALNGIGGQWLLDPNNLIIGSGGSDNITQTGPAATEIWTTNDNIATLDIATINTAFTTDGVSDLTIQTSGFGVEDGNIDLETSIDFDGWGAGNTLTLIANNNITIDDGSTISDSDGTTDSLNLVLTATNGNVEINEAITTGGGSFTSSGVNFDNNVTAPGAITTGGGAVNINHSGAVQIDADITTTGVGAISGAVDIVGLSVSMAVGISLTADGEDGGSPFGAGAVNIDATGGTINLNAMSIISAIGGAENVGVGGTDAK